MFYDWYPTGWWIIEDAPADCTNEDVMNFLNRALSLRRNPLVQNVSSVTDAGIVSLTHREGRKNTL
jgi:hypothetical protein